MRPRCDGCGRLLAVCLCPAMPSQRLQTLRTSVIIMQHPLETRHKLATVPVLARCLHPDSCEVIVGRRFRQGCSPQLDLLAAAGVSQSRELPNAAGGQVVLLFPGPKAIDLATWVVQQEFGQVCTSEEKKQDITGKKVTLLIVDATWQHAKEMVTASMPFLKDFVVQVCLPFDKHKEGLGMGDSDLILRKEPFDGFLSTMEAVSRALGLLEPDGAVIEQALLPVLQRMVSLQTAHLMPKKQQSRKNEEEEVEAYAAGEV